MFVDENIVVLGREEGEDGDLVLEAGLGDARAVPLGLDRVVELCAGEGVDADQDVEVLLAGAGAALILDAVLCTGAGSLKRWDRPIASESARTCSEKSRSDCTLLAGRTSIIWSSRRVWG